MARTERERERERERRRWWDCCFSFALRFTAARFSCMNELTNEPKTVITVTMVFFFCAAAAAPEVGACVGKCGPMVGVVVGISVVGDMVGNGVGWGVCGPSA